ncbi:MAG: hypothetical protein WD048_06095 [Chitinophagales bacterium]
MSISIKYIIDQKGRKTAVQIPIGDWENLLKGYKEFQDYKALKNELSEAINEINNYESGKKEPKTLKQFLDEL